MKKRKGEVKEKRKRFKLSDDLKNRLLFRGNREFRRHELKETGAEGKAETSKEWFKRTVKNMDPISWVMVGCATVAVVGVISFTAFLTFKAEAQPVGEDYYDANLNFNVTIPHGWEVATPDVESVKEITRKASGGILFDMKYHTLSEEIVPLALIQKPVDPKADSAFTKFMTIAFRGSNVNMTYLQDKVKLKEDFVEMLKRLEHTDIKISEAKNITDDGLYGVMLKGTAKLDGVKIDYIQYLEPAGKNMLIMTYGSNKKENEGVKDIKSILNTLIYQEGGATLPTPLQDEMKAETEKQVKAEEKAKKEAEEALKEENRKNTQATDATPKAPTGWGTPNKESDSVDVKVEDKSSDVKIKDSDGTEIKEE